MQIKIIKTKKEKKVQKGRKRKTKEKISFQKTNIKQKRQDKGLIIWKFECQDKTFIFKEGALVIFVFRLQPNENDTSVRFSLGRTTSKRKGNGKSLNQGGDS